MSGDTMGPNFLGNYLYSGQEIADRGNIIFVSVAYRVGALGFLSTGDSTLPGNGSFHLSNVHSLIVVPLFTKSFTSNDGHKTLLRVKAAFINRKLWSVGPARWHRLGAQEHPLIWWRPRKYHRLWRICGRSKCRPPGAKEMSP